jgi:hypothetical protein
MFAAVEGRRGFLIKRKDLKYSAHWGRLVGHNVRRFFLIVYETGFAILSDSIFVMFWISMEIRHCGDENFCGLYNIKKRIGKAF